MEAQKEANDLGNSVAEFIKAINDLSTAVKQAREAGLSQMDMHRVIFNNIPEEDKPAMQQQWPMISMLLSAL